jgi:hypothetical protein
VGFGITLDTRLTAAVQVNGSTKSNQADVSVGFGKILGFSADTKSAVESVAQHSSLSVYVNGAAGPAPPPEQLLEFGRNFGAPDTVAASTGCIHRNPTLLAGRREDLP